MTNASPTPSFMSFNIAKRWFFWLCSIHLLVWTIIPTWLHKTIPLDTAEGIVWGREWQWGYYKHPPLAAWLSNIAYLLQGSPGFSLYLLSQLAVIVTFWAVWRFSLKMLTPLAALLSVLLLETIYYYSFPTVQFNPNILLLPLWSLLILKFYEAHQATSSKNWILVGLLAGLCLLAKYESLILLICLLIFSLVNSEARKSFNKPGIYFAFFIMLILIVPNAIWLYKNNFLPVTYALDSAQISAQYVNLFQQHFMSTFTYLLEQSVAILPALVIFSLLGVKAKRSSLPPFQCQFLLLVCSGPFILSFLFCLILGIKIKAYWGIPYYSFIGTILFAFLQPEVKLPAIKRYLFMCALGFCGFSIGYITVLFYMPVRVQHVDYPAQQIAEFVTKQWHESSHNRLAYIAGPSHIVSNVGAYSSDRPSVLIDYNYHFSPWISEKQLQQKGAVFLLEIANNSQKFVMLEELKQQFPQLKFKGIYYFKQFASDKAPTIKIAMMFLE